MEEIGDSAKGDGCVVFSGTLTLLKGLFGLEQ